MSFKLRIWHSAQQVTITGIPDLVAKEVEKLSNQGFIILNDDKYDNGISGVFVDMEKPESVVEI